MRDEKLAMQRLDVEILGPVRAVADGTELRIGGPRQQALLAALALEIGRAVSVDALADAVWDGSPPEAVDRTFKTYVAKLRRALAEADGVDGAEAIRTETRGYRLDDDVVGLDAARFEDEVARARDHLSGGEAAEAELLLATALDRWRGEVLSGFADQAWARPEAVRLTELRVVAEELLTTAVLDAGRVAEAVASAEALVAAHPGRESPVRLLVLALYRAGRHGDALGTARQFRERLAEETGLDPSPQLTELEQMVLEQDPRLDRPAGGRRLRGYVLHEVLASTTIGAVHRAEQPSIGRDVAVTVVPAEQADDPDVVRLFEARMQQVAAVEHQRVVPLYDYWRHPGGAYLVTRLPGGGTLTQQLARGRIEADASVRMLRQVAEAVAAAHERGVVHGALSSDAVVLDEHGEAFLWGFSLLPPEEGPRGDLTALAALADELISRVGVGADAGHEAGELTVLIAGVASTDGRVTTVAGFARALDELDRSGTGTADASEVPTAPATPSPNPYRGLAAFRETDAEVFFGRDQLTREVVTRLARQPFVAVFGPSGSGKSSVVRAGVLPRLRSDGAYVTTMVPGGAPMAELGVALSRIAAVELPDVGESLLDPTHGLTGVLGDVLPTPGAEAVVVVDQFEELFTMASEDERAAFLGVLRDALDHPLRRVRVIATVRADFLGRVLDDAIAGPLVHDRSVLARPLTDDELHEVVVGPAEVAGVAVEPALATAIVADATRFPGSLPMVQFALTEIFAAAEDGTMRLAAYRRIGGIEGVLGQRAEEVYAGLDDAGRQAAQQLFARLVVPNDDGPPTRRRALRTELVHVPDEVIDAFGRARLLQFDHDQETREPTVEVTHEALFRAWPRLVAWIEEGEDDLRVLGHLTVAASEWDARGRAEADLYRGNRLDAAIAFAAHHRGELSGTETAFLDAARARRAREAEADRRTVRRLRTLTGGLAVGLVLALIAGSLALVAGRRESDARQQAEVARQAQEISAADEAETARRAQADAFAFAASSTYADDPDLGVLYATEAYAATGSSVAQRALLEVLTTDPRIERIWEPKPGRCGARSPDGDMVGVLSEPDAEAGMAVATLYDNDERAISSFPVPAEVACVVPDATGEWALTPLESSQLAVPQLAVRDAASGQEGARVDVGHVFYMRLSPTAAEVLVSGETGTVDRRSLPSLEVVATYEHDLQPPFAHPSWSDRGAAVLFPAPGGVRVVEEDGSVEVPYVGEFHGVAAIDERRLLLVATTDELQVIPYDDPGAATTIGLQGEPITGAGPILPMVVADGRTVGVPTSRGLELFDVVSGAPAGQPVELNVVGDVNLTADPEGRIFVTAEHTSLAIDTSRRTHIGTMVTDRDTLLDAFAGAAPDGSSYVVLDDTPSVRLSRSGSEVAVPPGPPGPHPITFTFGIGLLKDEAWVRLDFATATFQRWSGDELELEVDLSDRLPTGMFTAGQVLDTTDEHVLAVVTDDPTLFRGHALVIDHRTGDVVGFFDPDEAIRGPRTFGVFAGDDRVMTYHVTGTVGLWTLQGDPAPGHVEVPNGSFGFDANADGSRLAIMRMDSTIGLLDGDGELLGDLSGVASSAFELAFVDDHRLVSRHFDGTTRLWDLDAGRLLGTLLRTVPHDLPVWPLTVDSEADQLLHPSPEGLLRLDLDPDTWLQAACQVVARGLRPDEVDAVAPGWTLQDPCGLDADSG